jgi:hypothetical protein
MNRKNTKPYNYPYNFNKFSQKYGFYNCWSCKAKNPLNPVMATCPKCHNPSPTRAGTELMIQAMNNVPYPGPEDDDALHLQDAKTRFGILTKFQAISAIFSSKLNDILDYVGGILDSFEGNEEDE